MISLLSVYAVEGACACVPCLCCAGAGCTTDYLFRPPIWKCHAVCLLPHVSNAVIRTQYCLCYHGMLALCSSLRMHFGGVFCAQEKGSAGKEAEETASMSAEGVEDQQKQQAFLEWIKQAGIVVHPGIDIFHPFPSGRGVLATKDIKKGWNHRHAPRAPKARTTPTLANTCRRTPRVCTKYCLHQATYFNVCSRSLTTGVKHTPHTHAHTPRHATRTHAHTLSDLPFTRTNTHTLTHTLLPRLPSL